MSTRRLRSAFLAVALVASCLVLWYRGGTVWLLRRSWSDPKGHASCASFSPDGSLLALGYDDGRCEVLDVKNNRRLWSARGHRDFVRSIRFSPDGAMLVTASEDCTARLWSVGKGTCLRVLAGHSEGVNHAEFSPDGEHVATAASDRTVRVWSVRTGSCDMVLRPGNRRVELVSYSADGRRLITSGVGATVIWDARTGARMWKLPEHSSGWLALFIRNGTRVVSGDWDGIVRVSDAKSGECIRSFRGHSKVVTTLATSADESILATGSGDETARVWRLATGRCVGVLKHGGDVVSVFVSSSGDRIVTTSDACRLWYCRRPEEWWGIFWLWEFWAAVFFGGLLLWSLWRDRRYFKSLAAKGAAEEAH